MCVNRYYMYTCNTYMSIFVYAPKNYILTRIWHSLHGDPPWLRCCFFKLVISSGLPRIAAIGICKYLEAAHELLEDIANLGIRYFLRFHIQLWVCNLVVCFAWNAWKDIGDPKIPSLPKRYMFGWNELIFRVGWWNIYMIYLAENFGLSKLLDIAIGEAQLGAMKPTWSPTEKLRKASRKPCWDADAPDLGTNIAVLAMQIAGSNDSREGPVRTGTNTSACHAFAVACRGFGKKTKSSPLLRQKVLLCRTKWKPGF